MENRIRAENKWNTDNGDNGDRCWWWLASLFMAAMMALVAMACQEEREQLSIDEVLLSLSLTMPGESGIHSRAISSAAENTLNNIRILVFEVNGLTETFAYEAAVIKTSNPMTIRVKKSKESKKYRLVLIANAQEQIPFIKTGTSKDVVLRSITFKSAGQWKATSDANYTPIPMWGETATAEVITESTDFQPISLLRALVRIDVGLALNGEIAAGLSNFKLTSVSVYRSKDRGYVAPVNTPAEVSIPIDTINNKTLTYSVTDNKGLIRTIYLAEAPASTTRDHALCLVIGGKYDTNTTTSYYRVDFKKENKFAPLKRNCRYVVNITKVTASGYDTEAKALAENKNIGISGAVTVDDWKTGTGNGTTAPL